MMIYSMTGFARAERQGGWGNLISEMRSVNHRYLEISLYVPELLRVFEMPIRERIRQKLIRGKIECVVRYQPSGEEKAALYRINPVLAKALCQASEQITALLTTAAPISPTDILRFPGVLETKEADLGVLEKEIFALIESTLNHLVESRQREGEELIQLFLQRINLIQDELAKIRAQLPQILKDQQARLKKRFAEAKLELDPTRLEQEMLIFSQKIDVSEEIERTATHLTEIRRVLKQGGVVGRRLDFILQELNREANTLGSKSVDTVMTHAVVEMKVLIEQMREQVQNVE